jgi:hypothetical protein
MSIDSIEKYIQELEAIKNYSQVRQERDDLSQEVEELKANLGHALEEINSLKSSKANLDGADMTLEEARLHFLQMQDAEVEKRAADKFERLRADYESKMPELVYQRLCDILGQPAWPEEIAKLIDTEARKKAYAILQHQESWPPWFKKLYDGEVEKKVSGGLNEEFNARVETAAETRARQRLNELIATHWPTWHRENVEPRIVELEHKMRADALQLLRGPWTFVCDRCDTSFNTKLTAGDIEQLLKTGHIKITCANSECENRSSFAVRRHTFPVFLYDLIDIYIKTIVVSKK